MAFDEKAKQLMDVRTVLLTSITSALAFVVGLFWNDAIRSAIEQLVPPGDNVSAKFMSAIIVTIIVVIVVLLLYRAHRITEENILARLRAKQLREKEAKEKQLVENKRNTRRKTKS